jgi:hypothetical protein
MSCAGPALATTKKKKECLEFEIGAWPIGHDKSSPVPGAILNNNTTSSILNL